MTDPLRTLGDAVAREQDEALAERDDLRAVRARLLAKPPAKSRASLAWISGAALAAAAIVIAIVWPRENGEQPALTYRVGAEHAPAAAGRWISTDDDVALRFSDGSEVSARGATDLCVTELDSRGARVHVEHGEITASVHHREATRWTIEAGPFEVRVVGTRFDVAWDPSDATFVLRMREGRVELTGPIVERRDVSAGEVVRVVLREGSVEIARAGAEEERAPVEHSAPVSPPIAPPAPAIEQESEAPSEPEPERPAPAPSPPAFASLARAGRYRDAVDTAVRAGWDATLSTASATSLFELADAARLAGEPSRAVAAYGAVRRRFRGSAHATRAAFALGRLAFDQLDEPANAARWFQTYLREAPDGALAQEALGRLIEARRASGDAAGARAAAERYVEAYPSGPHAPLARSLAEPSR